MENIELFLEQNPWQTGKTFRVEPFIKREIFQKISNWLKREEIITITGPRQAGKTTILLKIIEGLLHKDKGTESAIYYFNFDQEDLREEFKRPQQLFSFVKSRTQHQKYWLFLDEAQRLKEAGLYLKILHDLPQKPFKIIVSGSSSLLLRAKTKEHLTGRQIEFRVFPLSFREVADDYGFQLPAEHSGALQGLLEQFAIYGGYPKPFQEKNPEIKQQLFSQLYRDYVQRDIRDFAGVEKVAAFNKLTGLLAYQVGNLVNKEELSTSAQLDMRTIDKYLEILEQTFVVSLVSPYFTNRRKEIVKSQKVYYLDSGLRNARLANFTKYELRPDRGALFENLILTELIKYQSANTQIRYWRTQAGAEVDFILITGQTLLPIEVKTTVKTEQIPQGLRSFINKYDPPKALVVSENFTGKKQYQKTIVKFIPFSRLLEIFEFT